jgi:hypothetical protein
MDFILRPIVDDSWDGGCVRRALGLPGSDCARDSGYKGEKLLREARPGAVCVPWSRADSGLPVERTGHAVIPKEQALGPE